MKNGVFYALVVIIATVVLLIVTNLLLAQESYQLPTWRFTAPANNHDPCEYSDNWYSGAYRHYNSASTPLTGPNGRDHGRLIHFTGESERTWWLLATFRVPQGIPGRIYNMHDVAGDTYWGGVSPWAIDFGSGDSWEGQDGVVLTLEGEAEGGRKHHWSIVPMNNFDRSARYDLTIKLVLGRRGASKAGATTIWVNGNNTPVVSLTDVNTVYNNQNWVQFWEGAYVPASQGQSEPGIVEMAATRVGRTVEEALRDGTNEQPIIDKGIVGCLGVYRSGSNQGNSTVNSISFWNSSDFRVPLAFSRPIAQLIPPYLPSTLPTTAPLMNTQIPLMNTQIYLRNDGVYVVVGMDNNQKIIAGGWWRKRDIALHWLNVFSQRIP